MADKKPHGKGLCPVPSRKSVREDVLEMRSADLSGATGNSYDCEQLQGNALWEGKAHHLLKGMIIPPTSLARLKAS